MELNQGMEFIKILKEFNVPEEKAVVVISEFEKLANSVYDSRLDKQTASKLDVMELKGVLKGDIAELKTELKGDIKTLETKIEKSKSDMLIWLVGLIVIQTAFLYFTKFLN